MVSKPIFQKQVVAGSLCNGFHRKGNIAGKPFLSLAIIGQQLMTSLLHLSRINYQRIIFDRKRGWRARAGELLRAKNRIFG